MTPHELSHPLLPLLGMRVVDTKKGSDASEVSSYNTLAIYNGTYCRMQFINLLDLEPFPTWAWTPTESPARQA